MHTHTSLEKPNTVGQMAMTVAFN